MKNLKNPNLLVKVAEMIRAERIAAKEGKKLNQPKFWMNDWGEVPDLDKVRDSEHVPACATVACVAGFIAYVLDPRYFLAAMDHRAGKSMGGEDSTGFKYMAEEALFTADPEWGSDEYHGDWVAMDEKADALFVPGYIAWGMINTSPWTPELLEWMAANDGYDWEAAAKAIMPKDSFEFFMDSARYDAKERMALEEQRVEDYRRSKA